MSEADEELVNSLEELCNAEEQDEDDQEVGTKTSLVAKEINLKQTKLNVTVITKKTREFTEDNDEKKVKNKPLKQLTILDWNNQPGRMSISNADSLLGVGVEDSEQVDNEGPEEVKTTVFEVKVEEEMLEDPVASKQQRGASEGEVETQEVLLLPGGEGATREVKGSRVDVEEEEGAACEQQQQQQQLYGIPPNQKCETKRDANTEREEVLGDIEVPLFPSLLSSS